VRALRKSEIGRGKKWKVSNAPWIPGQCGTLEFLSLLSRITVSWNWKQRNTNLDIAGYLYDIGHVKLSAAVCICKHLPVCIPNNGFLWRHDNSDKEEAAVNLTFLSTLTILSNKPNLHLTPSHLWRTRASRAYALIIASFPGHCRGPDDMGNYSWRQRSRWTPVAGQTCWWGRRAQCPPPGRPALTKPLACCFLLLLFFGLLPLLLIFQLASLPDVMGVWRKRQACLSFSPPSVGSSLKTSIVILYLILLPEASLASDFDLFLE